MGKQQWACAHCCFVSALQAFCLMLDLKHQEGMVRGLNA